MKLKTPIILFVTILVLAGIAHWDEWKTEQETAEKKVENKLFPNLKASEVEKLRLISKGEEVVLEKAEGVWKITSPLTARAQQEQVSSLVKTAVDLKYERLLNSENIEDFGLDSPQLRVFLGTKSAEVSVSIGNKLPVGLGVYLNSSRTGAKVLIGGQHIQTTLSKSLLDLRDRTLNVPSIFSLVSWEMERPDSKIAMIKKDGSWFLSDSNSKIDVAALEAYLRVLSGPVIESFVDSPSKELKKALSTTQPGTQRLANLRWQGKPEGEAGSLEILKNNENLYGVFPGSENFVKLSQEVASEIEKTAWDFQDKSIVNIDTNEVTKVVLDGATYNTDENKNWVRESDGELKDHVRLFLVDLEFSQATEIRDTKGDWELTEPLHQASIFSGESVVELSIWKHPKDPAVLILKKAHADDYYIADKSLLDNVVERELEEGS